MPPGAAFLGGVALILLSAAAAVPTAEAQPPGYDASHLQVKFIDDLDLGVVASGNLVDRSGTALRSTAAKDLLQSVSVAGGEWRRLAGSEEARMDELRAQAEQSLGRKLPDMNTWFVLRVPPGFEAAELIDALQRLPEVELATFGPLAMPAPTPADFQGFQGYLANAPAGFGAAYAWTRPGGTGSNVTIVDLEYSWNLDHADLPVIETWVPPGMIDYDDGEPDHGTAVLGEMASLDNGWGTTGAAHGATFKVAPVLLNLLPAIATQVTYVSGRLQPGDVILIEQQMAGPNYMGPPSQFGLVPVEWERATYDAIVTAVGNGIHVVEAAGNGSQNLDDPVYSQGHGNHHPFLPENDSGAIIVGAGAAPVAFGGTDVDRSRLSFSNYGSRIDLQGWGQKVVTAGYGGLYDSEGANLLYTPAFGGTSSASPIVASAVALLESVREAEMGQVTSPAFARSQLQATGAPQQPGTYPLSENIGPRPDLRAALGGVTGVPAASDRPTESTSLAAWPNPTSRGAKISFRLAVDGHVRAEVFDLAGRRVASPIRGQHMTAGEHQVIWNCRDASGQRVPAGVYGIRVSLGPVTELRKIVITE